MPWPQRFLVTAVCTALGVQLTRDEAPTAGGTCVCSDSDTTTWTTKFAKVYLVSRMKGHGTARQQLTAAPVTARSRSVLGPAFSTAEAFRSLPGIWNQRLFRALYLAGLQLLSKLTLPRNEHAVRCWGEKGPSRNGRLYGTQSSLTLGIRALNQAPDRHIPGFHLLSGDAVSLGLRGRPVPHPSSFIN